MSALTEALARAQAKFGHISKTKTATVRMKAGGEFSYNYADLGDVLSAVRPVLAEENIAVVQGPDVHDGEPVLLTRLLCGGESMEFRFPLPMKGLDAQGVGSLITYWRRYALCSALAIAAEDDDDGRAAQQPKPQRQQRQRRANRDISEAELKLITDVFDGMPDEERVAKKREFKERFGAPAELTREQVPEALAYMGLDAPFMKEPS